MVALIVLVGVVVGVVLALRKRTRRRSVVGSGDPDGVLPSRQRDPETGEVL